MADTRISEMAALAGADVADGDLLPIVDISAAAGAKNKTLTPVEARIALVTSGAVTTALGFTPADAATVVETPTGTGYVHVTDGVQDAAAGNPLVVETTDVEADIFLSATVIGSGDASAASYATTDTGLADVSAGATVTTLGNADANRTATSGVEGDATANTTATAVTGDAEASTLATTTTGEASAGMSAYVSGTGAASVSNNATATTGDAQNNALATTDTGNAGTNNNALVNVAGTATSVISATAGAHTAGVTAEANDATGATLEVNTGDDVGAAGQFLASDGASNTLWTTPLVRHAAGVPTGAPGVAELPFAFDSTAVTGGLYFWDGAAWVQCSVIP